jgi:hypothetical protein
MTTQSENLNGLMLTSRKLRLIDVAGLEAADSLGACVGVEFHGLAQAIPESSDKTLLLKSEQLMVVPVAVTAASYSVDGGSYLECCQHYRWQHYLK